MNRGYTREWYLGRVKKIRAVLGNDCGISSDMIVGFCSETEEEHQETLSLMDEVKYDFAYMFYYSERPGTVAAKKLADDVPIEVKKEGWTRSSRSKGSIQKKATNRTRARCSRSSLKERPRNLAGNCRDAPLPTK